MGRIRDQKGMLFVLKRAVRFGKVVRSDIMEAFGNDFGQTKASALMAEAAGRLPETLERRSHEIGLCQNPKIPPEA